MCAANTTIRRLFPESNMDIGQRPFVYILYGTCPHDCSCPLISWLFFFVFCFLLWTFIVPTEAFFLYLSWNPWVSWVIQYSVPFPPFLKIHFQSFMALVGLHDNSYHCAPTVLWGAHNWPYVRCAQRIIDDPLPTYLFSVAQCLHCEPKIICGLES